MDPILRDTIEASYGLRLVEITPLAGGLDVRAEVLCGADASGGQYVIKRGPNPGAGVALAAALSALGVSEVLAPILTRTGDSVLAIPDGSVVVYPFVQGANGFEVPLTREHWRSVGMALKRIHTAALPLAVLEGLRREDFRVEGEVEHNDLVRQLEANPRPNATEKGLLPVLDKHEGKIQSVFRRVRELGEICRSRAWDLVPCHADLHVGNILAGAQGMVTLIDWDAPRLAPRECDLMFFCGGGITGHGHLEEESFFEGYGEAQPDAMALTYYRYVRAMEDIVSFSREALELDDGQESIRYLERIFEPTMIVETAMRLDE